MIEGNRASIPQGIGRSSVFVADWSGEQLAIGTNQIGPGLKPFEKPVKTAFETVDRRLQPLDLGVHFRPLFSLEDHFRANLEPGMHTGNGGMRLQIPFDGNGKAFNQPH